MILVRAGLETNLGPWFYSFCHNRIPNISNSVICNGCKQLHFWNCSGLNRVQEYSERSCRPQRDFVVHVFIVVAAVQRCNPRDEAKLQISMPIINYNISSQVMTRGAKQINNSTFAHWLSPDIFVMSLGLKNDIARLCHFSSLRPPHLLTS